MNTIQYSLKDGRIVIPIGQPFKHEKSDHEYFHVLVPYNARERTNARDHRTHHLQVVRVNNLQKEVLT